MFRATSPMDSLADRLRRGGASTVGVAALAAAALALPLDISHLFLMVLGAVLASLVQQPPQRAQKEGARRCAVPPEQGPRVGPAKPVPDVVPWRAARREGLVKGHRGPAAMPATGEHSVVMSSSALPVSGPILEATDFGAQVDEFVAQIAPTVESDLIVHQLVLLVKKAVAQVFPEADVVGVAFGDVSRRTAFAVAVPEIHIVLNGSPALLMRGLQDKIRAPKLDAIKLHKMAVQACTALLLHQASFKFRRSAFTSSEPKVTLIAPPSVGNSTDGVVLDFSVNSVTPLYNAAVLHVCGDVEARAKELALLVKRWAKYRGMCCAGKGHLSPYAWSILTVYFLQVGLEEGPLLPPMRGASTPQGYVLERAGGLVGSGRCTKQVSELFQELVRFYVKMPWSSDVASVRSSEGTPPHLVMPPGGLRGGVPAVEDPFHPRSNVAAGVTEEAMEHLRQELARADVLMSRSVSLTELLEPWAPSEAGSPTSAASEKRDFSQLR